MMYDQTGSGKSKMVASKQKIPISHLVVKIGTKSQQLCQSFAVQLSKEIDYDASDQNGSGNFKMAASNFNFCCHLGFPTSGAVKSKSTLIG